jgi:hypothetical protein
LDFELLVTGKDVMTPLKKEFYHQGLNLL